MKAVNSPYDFNGQNWKTVVIMDVSDKTEEVG